jgi:ABC-type dipeptide/oligopeptide/nickel transport system permease subunit
MPRAETNGAKRRSFRGFRGASTFLGASIVILMTSLCVGSLPFTLGKSGSSEARRYEATNVDAALLPPFWAPHTEDEQNQLREIAETSGHGFASWLGTDRLGRSVLVRCLAGGGISLAIGFCAAALTVIIGTLYGATAGFRGGRTDAFMMRIVDVLYGLPYILLVVLLAVAVNGLIDGIQNKPVAWWKAMLLGINTDVLRLLTLLVAIGGVSWLTLARVIRGQVLSLKQQPFMEACRAIGVPVRRQFTRHLLPNLLGPIIVYATLAVPTAILSESFLSFLGIGVQEPVPSWGNLAASGLSELNTVRPRWWLLLWPCVLIAVTLLALNFMGEGLKERFDPKRRINRN